MKVRSVFRSTFVRELKILLFDRNLFMVALLAPVFYLFFYGSVYLHNVSTSINVAVLDYDHSSASHRFSRMLASDNVLQLRQLDDVQEARLLIEQGAIQGYLVIPAGMETKLKAGRRCILGAYINNNSFLVDNELNKRFSTLVESFNASLMQKYWQAKGIPSQTALLRAMPLRIDITPLGNAAYGYSSFLYPAIFILILHQLGLLSMCLSLAKEKEDGLIKHWSDTSQGNLAVMMLGKTAPYFILNVLYFLMLVVLAFPLFHLPLHCSLVSLLLAALLFYLALNACAWFVGSFFQNMLQAFQLIVLSSMPVIMLSGYTWPVYALPVLLKPLPFLLPAYPMMIILQAMTQTGAHLTQLSFYLLVQTVQFVCYAGLAWLRWKKISIRS